MIAWDQSRQMERADLLVHLSQKVLLLATQRETESSLQRGKVLLQKQWVRVRRSRMGEIRTESAMEFCQMVKMKGQLRH